MRVTGTTTSGGSTVSLSIASENGLRLSLTTAVPVTTSDVTAASTLYLTPYLSGRISIYDGADWTSHSTAEVSLALSGLTSGKNYDVFAAWSGSAVTIELGTVWTDDSTRAEVLTTQDGVLVKTGALTKRYIGTIRTTGTTTTEDSEAKRFVYNQYNRVKRNMFVTDTTDSWTYNSRTFQAARGQAGNCFEYVTGQAAFLEASSYAVAQSAANDTCAVGVGIDSTSTNSAKTWGATGIAAGSVQPKSTLQAWTALGYHKITWLEQGGNSVNATFYGDLGGLAVSGMTGTIDA